MHNRRRQTVLLFLICVGLLLGILLLGSCIGRGQIASDFSVKRQPPSLRHPFGTDTVGRDMLLRCLKGLSTSIRIGLISSLLGACMALVLGLAAALLGKFWDGVISWLVDLCMSVPSMVLMVMISFLVGKGARGVALGVALTHWPGITRIIRAEVMQIRSADFVLAARRMGKSPLSIAVFHILPHVLPQFLVGLILMFPHAIMHEASVTFLGFGLTMDTPAIGVILSESMKTLPLGMWWTALFPGLMLMGVVVLFHLLGKNAEKLLDPHTANQ